MRVFRAVSALSGAVIVLTSAALIVTAAAAQAQSSETLHFSEPLPAQVSLSGDLGFELRLPADLPPFELPGTPPGAADPTVLEFRIDNVPVIPQGLQPTGDGQGLRGTIQSVAAGSHLLSARIGSSEIQDDQGRD